jgi:hypothetical protein
MKRISQLGFAVFAAALVVAQAPSASAQGTITDGPATFITSTGHFDATPSTVFRGVSSVAAASHLFEAGWWYRISGDAAEKFFPVPTPPQIYGGNLSALAWANVDGRGFSATASDLVTNGGGPSGTVTMSLTVTNAGGTDLAIDMFHMADIDLAGSTNDTAVAVNRTFITVADGANAAAYRGFCANAHLVRPFDGNGLADTAGLLSNATVTNFDNTGLPFAAGDFTGGFQWTTRTIPPAGSYTFRVKIAVNASVGPTDLLFADGFEC